MKKTSALLAGFFAIAAIVSSVAVVARVFQRPTTTAPMGTVQKGIAEIKQELKTMGYTDDDFEGLNRDELEALLEAEKEEETSEGSEE